MEKDTGVMAILKNEKHSLARNGCSSQQTMSGVIFTPLNLC
jgi:hypothetical protein